MKTSDFDYYLPPDMIAQTPIEPRDHSRLMIIDRADGSIRHGRFFDLVNHLHCGDVLVFNNSRVIKARLKGIRLDTGRETEVFLLSRLRPNVWETLMRSKKKVTVGTKVRLVPDEAKSGEMPTVEGEVVELRDGGIRVIVFSDDRELPRLGKIPLPPYIHKPLENPERYQTVFAEVDGSVAAPTAGLHFTPELMEQIKGLGVQCLFVSLHVGIATFRPVREEDPRQHHIHREYGIVSQETADEISRAKREGRRVICVGTTSVRLVEAVANDAGIVKPFEGWVELYILPGFRFRITNAMVTNFHLPRSTLLMLVSAFAGKELISKAYQEAIAQGYRFYSFGDAMMIL